MNIEKKNHHRKNGFSNSDGTVINRPYIWDWLCFLWRRLIDKSPIVPEGHVIPQAQALEALEGFNNTDTLTWLGHNAFLIRLQGKTILTDAYLTDYAAPFAGLFFKRYVPCGIALEQLPDIDIILISHNHYDHLDTRTIEQLSNNEKMQIVAPLGLGKFFTKRGFSNVHELDWNDEIDIDGIKITSMPAIHFSQRTLFDRNKTLWMGFGIKGNSKNIFFSGDTAYGDVFTEMGERHGPFDYGLIAIGAYAPQKLMHPVHVTPAEAVQIGTDLHAKTLVGMHWGTVILTDEPPFEPPKLFLEAGGLAGYASENLWVMKIGETRVI